LIAGKLWLWGQLSSTPLSQGLVIGKIDKYKGVNLPREVLIEPLELGTPGAYVARVASRFLTSESLEKQGLGKVV
jgi:hypothetical protein